MSNEDQQLVSGLLGLPQPVPGTAALFEAMMVFDSGPQWRVSWDTRTRLATVFDANGVPLGWTERTAKNVRQVVLPGNVRPPVRVEDKWFSRIVWLEGEPLKAVMMLEGRKRVFGNKRLRVEHRDFTSEARVHAVPDLLVPGVLVAFEVYGAANCRNQGG